MSNFLSTLFLMPLLIWCVFQPALFSNSMLVEQAISNVVYETQKEVALQGRYDEDIYKKMKDRLVEVHNFNPEKIEIKGTETLTTRGERIEIEITVPKPKTTVIEAFSRDSGQPYKYKKYVMSEFANR